MYVVLTCEDEACYFVPSLRTSLILLCHPCEIIDMDPGPDLRAFTFLDGDAIHHVCSENYFMRKQKRIQNISI